MNEVKRRFNLKIEKSENEKIERIMFEMTTPEMLEPIPVPELKVLDYSWVWTNARAIKGFGNWIQGPRDLRGLGF